MLKKIFRTLFAILGGILWLVLGDYILTEYSLGITGLMLTVYYGLGILLFAIIFYLLSRPILKWINGLVKRLEEDIRKVPGSDLLTGFIGLVLGLFVAFLFTQPILRLSSPRIGNVLSVIISVVIYIIFGSLGTLLAMQRKRDISGQVRRFRATLVKERDKSKEDEVNTLIPEIKAPKILDTSVIIDGRIGPIIDAGFLEGTIVIPQFVLEELQHIADSEDNLRRQRGRRGLDLITMIQDHRILPVEIVHVDYPDIKEVDMKLLRLTKELDGKILTNDYNLNKVAKVQGLTVLNINELANAVKPIVIPGENMEVELVKEGKERNQGIAYLDDGTMIVVEEGKFHLGKRKTVEVTSVLQTSAGKMIFAKLA